MSRSGHFRVARSAAFLDLVHRENIAGPLHMRGRARGGIAWPDGAVPGLTIGGGGSRGAASGIAVDARCIHRRAGQQFP